jgi:galactose mutarotase-like enzyme
VTPLETIVLKSPSADATAVLAPQRGGMLTRWTSGGRSLLYLDEATLMDPSRSLRGGNPLLFPSPGPLVGERFAWGGREGSMRNHGLARQRPFSVVAVDGSSAMLSLASDEGTRAEFPWDFMLTVSYAFDGAMLTMEQRIENLDDAPMPFAFGVHPYFLVPDHEKPSVSVPTRAMRAWDNFGKRRVDVTGPIDLTAEEVDLHLEDHGGSDASLVLADGARIVVRGSEEFGRWVVWTQRGKDFVCLEPWTAAADALNTGEQLLVVEPGDEHVLEVSFSLER